MERACSLVTAVRFLNAKNGVDYKFSLHFLPGLWYTCLRNKCHAISTICLQLRESVGCRYRRCVLCSYLEEALTHTVTHTTKRMDGNSGEDRAYLPQYTEWKASKSLKKQRTEYPDTLRNQQVTGSNPAISSKKYLLLQNNRYFLQYLQQKVAKIATDVLCKSCRINFVTGREFSNNEQQKSFQKAVALCSELWYVLWLPKRRCRNV